MGRPLEYLHPDSIMKPMAQRFVAEGIETVTGNRYVEELLRRRATPHGVFGLKTFYWQAEPFVKMGYFAGFFEGAAYVHLTRADRRRQIVSLAIANQTDQWASYDDRRAEPVYDAVKVEEAALFLAHEAKAWEDFFTARGIAPLRLTYEELLAEPDRAARAVCALVGVEPQEPFVLERAATKKQGSALNEDWLARAEPVFAKYL
jgi:LPS sulfotransferase NodH